MKKAIILLIVLVINIFSFSFAEEQKDVKQEVNDFSLVQYNDSGGAKWKLNGKSATVIGNTVGIKDISLLSFGENTAIKLKAREGSFDKGNTLVRLQNDVVAKSTNGTALVSDYLEWNTQTKNVSTNTDVSIRKGDLKVNGRGAVCDMEGETAELKENVTATMKSPVTGIQGEVKPESWTVITCDGPLELNYKKNRAIFHNNVKVEDVQGNILADRIDVYFNPVTRRVKCVVARGNVKIVNEQSVTYSEKAIYLVEQGRVILPNRPRLVIESDSNTE